MARAAKVAPFTLLELTVRHSLAAVLSKPQWWVKRCDPAIWNKWQDEITREFLLKTLAQSLKWEPYELHCLRDLERIAESPDRSVLVTEWCTHVRYELSHRGSEESDDEEEDEDEDDDYKKKQNAYTFLLWYFTYAALRERLLAIPEELWSYETFRPAIQTAEGRNDSSVVPRTLDFILTVTGNGPTDESVESALQGIEPRLDVIALIRSHCAVISQELVGVRSYITQVLDQIAASEDFQVEITPSEKKVAISPTGIHGAWICDSLIPEPVKVKLVNEIAVLENVPDEAKDWHPKTNKQLLDLIHPSLYCCMLGKTKKVSEPPKAELCSSAAEHMVKIMCSASMLVENEFQGQSGRTSTFQWIPSDFHVNDDGTVRILSYINNLHPVHFTSLYSTIETIFARFVPLFERVLTAVSEEFPGPVFDAPDEYNERRPPIPTTMEIETTSLSVSLKGKTAQVIVKVAEILLTPDAPKYDGGSWHIEGTDTEQIVATGIYYFGCENVKDSRLSLRVNVEEPMYEQSDDSGVAVMYGLFNEDLLVQTLGSVNTIEDRCLVFPNVLQHKVEPFELQDPNKPGTRKILALFLIDPEVQIPSTSSIPPQQQEWIDEVQGPILKKLQLFQFAEETVKQMVNGDSMTLDEAKRYRLELMTERSALAEPDLDDYESYFNFSFQTAILPPSVSADTRGEEHEDSQDPATDDDAEPPGVQRPVLASGVPRELVSHSDVPSRAWRHLRPGDEVAHTNSAKSRSGDHDLANDGRTYSERMNWVTIVVAAAVVFYHFVTVFRMTLYSLRAKQLTFNSNSRTNWDELDSNPQKPWSRSWVVRKWSGGVQKLKKWIALWEIRGPYFELGVHVTRSVRDRVANQPGVSHQLPRACAVGKPTGSRCLGTQLLDHSADRVHVSSRKSPDTRALPGSRHLSRLHVLDRHPVRFVYQVPRSSRRGRLVQPDLDPQAGQPLFAVRHHVARRFVLALDTGSQHDQLAALPAIAHEEVLGQAGEHQTAGDHRTCLRSDGQFAKFVSNRPQHSPQKGIPRLLLQDLPRARRVVRVWRSEHLHRVAKSRRDERSRDWVPLVVDALARAKVSLRGLGNQLPPPRLQQLFGRNCLDVGLGGQVCARSNRHLALPQRRGPAADSPLPESHLARDLQLDAAVLTARGVPDRPRADAIQSPAPD